MNRPLHLLAMLLAIGLAGRGQAAESWTVKSVPLEDRKAVIATVEAVHQLPARARIGGTIAEVKVKEGDRVAAGDRLALVVDKKLMLQMQSLDARQQAQEAAAVKARLDYDRAQQLRASGTVSQMRLDDAKAQLEIAERTLKAARSERDVVSQEATEGAVLAPGDGRVLKVPVAVGSVVLPGELVAMLAADSYILRLQLPERHARFMRAGDLILVGERGMQDEKPEAMRTGRVKLVYPEIEQGRVIADVEVEGLGDYFVGERTRVYVATGSREALIVPEGYLRRRFGVYTLSLADGTELVVQPGAPAEGGIEILSGLKAGDVVVKP